MFDDFCLIHGYDYMMREFGNPIAHCWKCEQEKSENADSKYQKPILSDGKIGDDMPKRIAEIEARVKAAKTILLDNRRACLHTHYYADDVPYLLESIRRVAPGAKRQDGVTGGERPAHALGLVYKSPEKLTQSEQTDDESNYDPARDPCNWPENIR